MSIWPRWSMEGEPAALAKYVLPDEVAALVHLPGPPASSRIAQVRAVYEALADVGITYSHEAPSDEPDRQVIRDPGEVLWSPKHATCLDLALIMAGACLHADLHPLVLILDPPETGRAAHALLGVWVGDPSPDGPQLPDTDVWSTPPEDWLNLVQQDPDGRPRSLLLIDPVGLADPLPTSPILGARANFSDAVHAGADYAAAWDWRLAVDIGRSWRQQDTHAPADRPADKPMRRPYVELDPHVHRPLEVLKAEHAVVPFQARDELTVLTHFCRTVAAGRHTGIAVVDGVGGAGKTRLALELAERMATREGWYTGFLREGSEGRDWLGAVVSPTLIVLDYAEARAADAQDLLATLKRRIERGATPAVVVMTARSAAGQWLTALRKTWQRDGHLCRELAPLELPPDHPDGSAVFRRAVDAFLEEPGSIDVSVTATAAPMDWTTLDYILLAYLVSRSPGKLPTTREELYEEVLNHERGYWGQIYTEVTNSTEKAPLGVLNRAVACLTLRAPTTRLQTLNALRAVDELADDARWRETIHTTLTTCLQPGPGEALVLRPDPIADHLTLHELNADPSLLNRALDGLDPEPLLSALRQLNRAATASPDTATRMIRIWASAEPDRWRPVLQVAADQGGTALAALHQLIGSAPSAPWLDDLSQAIPFRTLGLPYIALQADTHRLTALRSATDSAPADLAGLLRDLSLRQLHTGDWKGALASISEAVDILRPLAQANPAAHLPDLVLSLSNLSGCQSETGDRNGALTSSTEAVDILRTLAQTNPDGAHLPDLATCLTNLSRCQSDTGDSKAALTSNIEAVDILRTLAQTNPDGAHLPDLATCLSNLSAHQSNRGDHDGALTSITEAVKIRRTLTQTSPTAHLPDLAICLSNLSNHQSHMADHDEALASITEAVKIRRTLAQANPAAHLPGLAVCLTNLSACQGETGDRNGALTSSTEAVDILRPLADTNPGTHLPDLATCLSNLSAHQSHRGDHDGALASITEAVKIRRTLTQNTPTAHLPDLAICLSNLSIHQSHMGDHDEALASITEAVKIRRTLARANPAAYLPDLAAALNNLSAHQESTGDRDGALASGTEAVSYYRTLAQDSPTAHLPDLAMSLNNLSDQQTGTGDHDGALASITEAVKIRRTLVQANPLVVLPNLATSLSNLSGCQSETGDRNSALASSTEAVDILRTVARTTPAAHLPNLAAALSNLSGCQSETGDRNSALASSTEAVDILRTVARTTPAAHLPNLAAALSNLSGCQSETGDRNSALASVTEAVSHYRTLAQDNPAVFLPALAMSLNNLSNRQSGTGDHDGALASITEAVKIRRTLGQNSPTVFLPALATALNNLSLRQSGTGDHDGALASITEAVKIRRTLAQNSPAVFLPALARSLNNLYSCHNRTGDHEAARASITEAVGILRPLAQDNPAAHLPDFVTTLNDLSACQSDTSMTSAIWEDSIRALEVDALAQAELQAHYAAYLAKHVSTERALGQLIHSAHIDTGSPEQLGRARHRVRNIAITYDMNDSRLPDWATHPLPDESLELLDQWAQTADWPSTETLLRAHADRFQQPDFLHHLHLAAALFPGNHAIDHLDALLAEVDSQGFNTVLEQNRREHDQRHVLNSWIHTPTWAKSKEFLDEYSSTLQAPAIHALLASADSPVARQHLAILQLSTRLPHDQVYEIVTDPDTAIEHAFHAIDQADMPHLRQVLHAHASQMTGAPRALFATVISLADSNTDQARQLANVISQHATHVQRRAYAIHLRALAQHNSELAPAEELANLIDPDNNS